MAASTSRQPHKIPLPPSPSSPVNSNKKSSSGKSKGKGKGKEQATKRRVGQASAGSKTWDDSETESTWDWVSLTDSSASKFPPVFTKDGRYFFSLVGSSVEIHSVATGQIVSTLSAPRPPGTEASSDLLTSAVLNPHNPFQLITGSLNGCLVVWDFLEAALLQTIDIAQPIYHICAHDQFKDSVFVAASRPSKGKNMTDDNAVVLRVSLKPTAASARSRVQKSAEIIPIGKTRFPAGLALSPSGAWLVAVAGHKAYVAMTSSLKAGFTKYVSPERLTCLAFHPSEDYFGTGDDKGHIRLWYCLNEHVATNAVGVEKKAQTTAFHWHAHAVSSIAFTANGAYLLSGGEEAVLVLWQLHTGKKEFVPRIGSPIKTVALSKRGDSEEEYLLGLADATYVFINAGTLKISRSYARIKLDPETHVWSSTSTPAPLAVHSLTSTLILPSSHPSSLQIYSPSSSGLISELEISPSNRVSRQDDKPILPTKVERATVAPSGVWMASIDSREGDDTFRGEIYLKIWWWDHKAGYWILNTRIDRPHGLKKVTAVVFSPVGKDHHSLHLVTTGEDGNIKSWRMRTMKQKAGDSEGFWVPRSTFSFRSEVPTHASFSPDGSLLAISLGPYVAIYDPDTNVLRQTVTSMECKAISSAHFVGKGGRFLAVVGIKDLVLWDLVQQCVRWHHKSTWELDTIVSHPVENTFALFHRPSAPSKERQQTRISIFHVLSAVPSSLRSVPFHLRNLVWYATPSRSPESSSFSLVGITHVWNVVLFGDNVRLPEENGSSARPIVADSSPHKRTLFQDIFGKSAFSDLSNELPFSKSQPTTTVPRTGKEFVDIFDGPTYLFPPLDSLFEPLINGFLKTRLEDTDVAGRPDVEFDGGDMDIEEESGEPFLTRSPQRREIDREEMVSLIDLFKMHTIQLKPSPPLLRSGTTNGASKGEMNGTAHRSVQPFGVAEKQNGRSTSSVPAQSLAIVAPSSPSLSTTRLVNGKKRKKSLP